MARPRTPPAPDDRAAQDSSQAVIDALAPLTEIRDALQAIVTRLDRLAAALPALSMDDYAPGRDRDPGDAVPEGVAPQTPLPLTDADEKVLHTLEELPRRAGQRGGPQATAGAPSGTASSPARAPKRASSRGRPSQ